MASATSSLQRITHLFLLLASSLILIDAETARSADWPAWRFDSGRTASTPASLPDQLQQKWSLQFTPRKQTWDDPLNNDLMQYDRVFEPIVLRDHLIVGFNDSDKVVCFHTENGQEVWRYYVDGPVRFPPVGWRDKVYFVSDDGFLYCLNARTGTLLWRFQGGPSQRKVLGNRRVISMWPARGGPVVRDGKVYFAASIWPLMGTFIYALDAETGDVEWVNDGTSSDYIRQPHSAPSFAGIAPQGALAATSDYLVVPGGRSVPGVFDRHTGKLVHFHLNEGGKGTGGSLVMANDTEFYVHTRRRGTRKFHLESGKKTEVMVDQPVIEGDWVYSSTEQTVSALDSLGNVVWELPIDGSGDLIKSGNRLYAAGSNQITAIELTSDGTPPTSWKHIAASGSVERLLAGNDMLFAVTAEGSICAFAGDNVPNQADVARTKNDVVRQTSSEIEAFLDEHDAAEGYGFVFGVDDEVFLDDLLEQSRLHLVVVDPDRERVARLRAKYDQRGLYGDRIAIHHGVGAEFAAPPYIAHLVVVGTQQLDWGNPEALRTVYESVRPYGGLLWFTSVADNGQIQTLIDGADLPKAVICDSPPDRALILERSGNLEGAAPWTHLYGDVANTVKSNDRRVKAPLGVLWFGGNSHVDVLPRHSHAPSEQVIGGRLFVEGMNSLSARDVYTGRLLWKHEFGDLGTEGVYYDDTYKDTPLDTAYNQKHIPGANSRGTNFVATEDRIYLAVGAECHVLNARTGETDRVIPLPATKNGDEPSDWTYIGVYGDILLAGVDFADFSRQDGFRYVSDSKKSNAWSPEWFGSRGFVALDRITGRELWSIEARYAFIHNGIVGGNDKIFLLDKLPSAVEAFIKRRGRPKPVGYRILALDSRTGEIEWERTDDVFGTWLSFSEKHDILVHSGSASADRALSEVDKGLIALQGKSGSEIWHLPDLKYAGPFILHNDWLMANSRSYKQTTGVFHLKDGSPVLVYDPLTNSRVPWQYERAYGCNTAVASEYLLTFRSGAAGYYDLQNQSGVGNLGGFRSGCSSNLIVADGVLNAPDFTRTCSCGYQNQTSLALIHMPEVETWSVHRGGKKVEFETELQRVGINVGAPGTRRHDDGTLWLPYPNQTDETLPALVEFAGENVEYVRRHTSVAKGELAWINTSGIRGARLLTLTLAPPDAFESQPQRYNLTLHFTKLPKRSARKHYFDLSVNGITKKQRLDAAGATNDWDGFQQTLHNVHPIHGRVVIAFKGEEADLPFVAGIEIEAIE